VFDGHLDSVWLANCVLVCESRRDVVSGRGVVPVSGPTGGYWLYWYRSTNTDLGAAWCGLAPLGGSQFTCFTGTGTEVRILTRRKARG
jgi:hypothetical protein